VDPLHDVAVVGIDVPPGVVFAALPGAAVLALAYRPIDRQRSPDWSRVKTVKTPGGFEIGFEALEAATAAAQEAAAIAQERVEESRDEVAKADSPEERERAADKLQEASAALGRAEAARKASHEFALLAEVTGVIESLNDPLTTNLQVRDYLLEVAVVADFRIREEGGPLIYRAKVIRAAAERLSQYVKAGGSVDEAISMLGTPAQFAGRWIAGMRRGSGWVPGPMESPP
jgi:hypothetical protein